MSWLTDLLPNLLGGSPLSGLAPAYKVSQSVFGSDTTPTTQQAAPTVAQPTAQPPYSNTTGYTNLPSDFIGPVKPGQTIGGVDPLAQPNQNVTPPSTDNGGGGGGAVTAPAPAAQADVEAQQAQMAKEALAQQEILKNQRIASDTETINRLYQEAMGNLGTREQQATNNLSTTEGTLNTEADASKGVLGSALQRALDTLKMQRGEAAGIQSKATQQATDLANQSKVDQEMAKREGLAQTGNSIQNAAQAAQNFLGSRGIMDSSASQAMGELIYRQGAGDISKTMQNLQTNIDKINKTLGTNIIDINADFETNIKNIQNEETNATGFYQDSIAKLEAAKTSQLAEARNVFNNAMLEIGNMRTQYGKNREAEIKKAQTDAWNEFQNNSFTITQQAQQDKLSLDKWAMERQAALDDSIKLANAHAAITQSTNAKQAELENKQATDRQNAFLEALRGLTGGVAAPQGFTMSGLQNTTGGDAASNALWAGLDNILLSQ